MICKFVICKAEPPSCFYCKTDVLWGVHFLHNSFVITFLDRVEAEYICVLLFTVFCIVCAVFLYCFIYVYLFLFVTTVRATATE